MTELPISLYNTLCSVRYTMLLSQRVYCTKYNYTNIYKTYCHNYICIYDVLLPCSIIWSYCMIPHSIDYGAWTPSNLTKINSILILVVLLYADRRAANMLAVTSQQHQPRKRPALAPVDPLPSSSSTTTNNSSKSNRTATTHQHNTKTVCKIVWT